MSPVEDEVSATSLSELGERILTPEQKEMIEAARQAEREKFDERVNRYGLDHMISYNTRHDPGESWPYQAELCKRNKKKGAP